METWTIRFTLRIDCLRIEAPCCVFTHSCLEQLCALRMVYCVLCAGDTRNPAVNTLKTGCLRAVVHCVLRIAHRCTGKR